MQDKPHFYEICFCGQIAERHAHWFDEMSIINLPDGNTLLTGELPDQPALYGILNRIRDLDLELIHVRKIS